MALADIPGYGAYVQRRQMNEQQPLAELQQASGAIGLLAKIQEAQQGQQMRELMAASGGDTEKAMEAALKAGNAKAAEQLAPVMKLYQEKKMLEQTPALLADLNRQFSAPQAEPQQPQELGEGQPIATAGAPPAPTGDPRQRRIEHLTAMSMIPKYANNTVVMQRIQAEIDKLAKPEHTTRTYQKGEESITEEQQPDGTWKELGRGPKFAKQVEPVNGPDAATQPTPDTLEMDAWRYLTDGTLPTNMGRGVQGAGQATAIRNRSAALAKEMGMTPDEIRMAQLTNKTQVQAIGQLAKAKAQILQFEKTANMNSDLALEASEKVDRTGVPVLNRWIQAGRTQIAGDPEASKFHAATETFVSEYAKVMSGGYGAAATTEGAQQRAHGLLNTAQTKEQFRANVTQLKREMANRVKALNGQMEEERQNLRGGINRNPRPTPSPAPAANPSAAPSVESLLEKYK
jgi:hypothetical protein